MGPIPLTPQPRSVTPISPAPAPAPWRFRAALALSLLLAAGCSQDRRPIRIGWGGGPLNDSTIAPSLNVARLAVEEINAAGGVRGRPLELVVLDDQGEVDSAVKVAAALLDSGVVAVIGHIYSSTTLASALVYNDPENPVLQISPSATSPDVSNAGEWTFRVCPSDAQYGGVLARWAHDRLGLTAGTVLYVNNTYGRGIRQTFTREFTRLGGRVIDALPFLEESPEVGVYLDRIQQDRNTRFVVLAGNITEATAIVRDMRGRGITLPVMGGDGLDGIEESLGPMADGVYVSLVYLPTLPSDANRRFLEAYRTRYPLGSPIDYSAAATYDIVHLLKTAIERAGPGRRELRDAVAATGRTAPPFDGLTGRIAFDEHGDVPTLDILVGVVRNGTIRPAEER